MNKENLTNVFNVLSKGIEEGNEIYLNEKKLDLKEALGLRQYIGIKLTTIPIEDCPHCRKLFKIGENK